MKLPPALVLLLVNCCSNWRWTDRSDQLIRIELDLIFLGRPAEARHIHHAGHALEGFSSDQSSSDFFSITS